MTRWGEDSKAKQRQRARQRAKAGNAMPSEKDYKNLHGKLVGMGGRFNKSVPKRKDTAKNG